MVFLGIAALGRVIIIIIIAIIIILILIVITIIMIIIIIVNMKCRIAALGRVALHAT